MATLTLRERLADPRWWLGMKPKELTLPAPKLSVSVIIPAYNKGYMIREVVDSVRAQSYKVNRIIIVNDSSSDDTEEVASSMVDDVVLVLTTPKNLGKKAASQNFALDYIESKDLETDVFITLDGDTILAPDAIEQLLRAFNHPKAIIASGTILSKDLGSVWQRGRHVQHLVNSALIRPSQSHNDALLVASGCFGAYHFKRFKEVAGRFPEDTIIEDFELTNRTHAHGENRIFFMSNAVCYTEDPDSLKSLTSQLERWYRGLMRSMIIRNWNVFGISKDIGWDLLFFFVFLVIGPVMLLIAAYTIFVAGGTWNSSSWVQNMAELYLFGLILIGSIVAWKAYKLRMFWQTMISIPAVFLVQTIDFAMYLHAFFMEVVRRKELKDWNDSKEKSL